MTNQQKDITSCNISKNTPATYLTNPNGWGIYQLKMFAKATIRDLQRQERKLVADLARTKLRLEQVRGVLQLAGKGTTVSHVRVSPLRLAMTSVFQEAGKPVRVRDLRKTLLAKKVEFNDEHFWKMLWRLKAAGVIKHSGTERGLYVIANPESKTPATNGQ